MVAFLGWLGSILYLVNHGYISVVKNWRNDIYYGGNLVAALSLVISSLFLSSYQAVVINTFWAVISFLLLIKVDITKVAIPKQAFYVGFISFIGFCTWSAWQSGLTSLNFYTSLGWSSSFVFCLSYFLFSSKKLSHIQYLSFNFYASVALLPLLWQQDNLPVFTLQICWAGISAFGVYKRMDNAHLID
ncbi:hypothetical protein HR060_14250 [Catenovulum sp. SM1970]|uniref:CBU_0592 family membrane protein n=1 Tax=Marinifaba aquimaris TaxID=2741323 RepID=UPI001573C95C|nr:hypothetical protein [Marinifaba aquimaris]NTS78017.1 hypothetical protein [Marinifaba aquimaris]